MHNHVNKAMSDAIKKVNAMSVEQLMVEMDKVKDREFVHNLAAIFSMMHEEAQPLLHSKEITAHQAEPLTYLQFSKAFPQSSNNYPTSYTHWKLPHSSLSLDNHYRYSS